METTLKVDKKGRNYPLVLIGKSGQKILEVEDNGDIFVHGELIENNKQVVDALIEWLKVGGYLK